MPSLRIKRVQARIGLDLDDVVVPHRENPVDLDIIERLRDLMVGDELRLLGHPLGPPVGPPGAPRKSVPARPRSTPGSVQRIREHPINKIQFLASHRRVAKDHDDLDVAHPSAPRKPVLAKSRVVVTPADPVFAYVGIDRQLGLM